MAEPVAADMPSTDSSSSSVVVVDSGGGGGGGGNSVSPPPPLPSPSPTAEDVAPSTTAPAAAAAALETPPAASKQPRFLPKELYRPPSLELDFTELDFFPYPHSNDINSLRTYSDATGATRFVPHSQLVVCLE